MQKTIYECNKCNTEIGNVAHFTLNFAGNGRTSGIALPPKAKHVYWRVSTLPHTWIHLHFGCVSGYFKALQKEVKP